MFYRSCWQRCALQDRLVEPTCSSHRIVSLVYAHQMVLNRNKHLRVCAENRLSLCMDKASRAAQQGPLLLATPAPPQKLHCLPLLSILAFPAGSTENCICFDCTRECFKGQNANWLACIFHWFHFIAGWQNRAKSEAKISSAGLGNVYLIDLWPFYVWKVILGRKLLFLKWTLSPAENYTLDLMFTKSPTWRWRAGRWGFSPLRWCCEKFHVSFSNWRLVYDLSKFAVLQQVVKSRFSKCQDCVGYLAFPALILYITRKRMFFNIPLGL